jgi:hypothetical protein
MHRRAVALLPTAAIVGISVSASAADVPRKALHQFWGRTDGTGGHGVRWRQRKLTDNIVRVGVNYKFF